MKIVKKFINYIRYYKDEILVICLCILIGFLIEIFISDTKYYPSFLNDFSLFGKGLIIVIFLLIVLNALYYLSKKIYFLLKEIFE